MAAGVSVKPEFDFGVEEGAPADDQVRSYFPLFGFYFSTDLILFFIYS